jgi:hypothetical protein
MEYEEKRRLLCREEKLLNPELAKYTSWVERDRRETVTALGFFQFVIRGDMSVSPRAS